MRPDSAQSFSEDRNFPASYIKMTLGTLRNKIKLFFYFGTFFAKFPFLEQNRHVLMRAGPMAGGTAYIQRGIELLA